LFTAKDEDLPIVGTIAAQFNDAGVNELFEKLVVTVEKKTGVKAFMAGRTPCAYKRYHYQIADHSAEKSSLFKQRYRKQQEL
jgi:hypothetical protein